MANPFFEREFDFVNSQKSLVTMKNAKKPSSIIWSSRRNLVLSSQLPRNYTMQVQISFLPLLNLDLLKYIFSEPTNENKLGNQAGSYNM